MNVCTETSSEIDQAAAAWATRVDRGLTPEEAAALDAWLAQDSRRLGAFARAQAVMAHFDRPRSLEALYSAEQFAMPSSRPGWRQPKVWMGMAAACLMAALGLWLYRSHDRFATQRGEVRLVSLADGSAITLNTASKVAVRYTEGQRHIELIEGEVLFNVVRSSGRPFIVDAGGTQVRVLGTSFTVRRMQGKPVRVLVREGSVQVRHVVAGRPVEVKVAANTRLEVPRAERLPLIPSAVTAGEVARELAWRDGMISLDGITLREAAAEFARYSDFAIVTDDPAVAELTVAGLFAAGNPAGFAQAVATSMGLKADVMQNSVRLHR